LKLIAALAGLLSFLFASSQDTISRNWVFKKNIRYWGKWQTYATDAQVRMPEHIRDFRQNNFQLPVTFDTITDNPLRHGATYVALQTQTTYRNKIDLFVDVYGEHRGVSYGLYDQNNTVLYPIMRLEASDTVNLFSKRIEISGKAGQFLNERLDEGLQIYNIDVQGFQVRVAFANYELQYTLYGDLYNGIGLNIDDLHSYSLRRKFANNKDHIGLSWVVASPPHYPLKNHFNLNLFGGKYFGKTNLYAQLSYRPFEFDPATEQNLIHQAAVVLGIKTQKQGRRFYYKTQAELRYYGWQYNLVYRGAGARYRKPANDIYEMYANTVGKYLYPLRKFETPFSQWAVFTEYAGQNVLAASLQGKFSYTLSSRFEASLDYDLNLVKSKLNDIFYLAPGLDKKTVFFYPFFEPAISYTPADNFKASIFFSNKSMNLDVSYPTHYLLAKPAFGLSVEANF
jgi:hypothetical protein